MSRPSPPASASHPANPPYGRADELNCLFELFEFVANKRIPHLAVISGDRGLGKSALVQALYHELRADHRWRGFWPVPFQDPHDYLKVNPDFPEDYKPRHPPSFLWLGMRWRNPHHRNPVGPSCPLPHVLEVLKRHDTAIAATSPRCRRFLRTSLATLAKARCTILTNLAALSLANLYPLEASIGLATYTVLDYLRHEFHTFKSGHVHPRKSEDIFNKRAGKELCKTLTRRIGSRRPLPTIVWLDDVQWIDAISFCFLQELIELARDRKLPLLVIATHCQPEWTDAPFGEENRLLTLRALVELQEHPLAPGDDTSLARFLHDRLSGLTSDQQNLLIEKSGGNFLALEESINELSSNSGNFKASDRQGALTDTAVRRISAWETDRDRRVKQRFAALDDTTKEVLGWCSQGGDRFIWTMISDFLAESHHDGHTANERIARCVEREALLAGSMEQPLMTFRDPAYYTAAKEYFKDYLARDTDEGRWTAFGRKWFCEWINSAFDADGHVFSADSAPKLSLPTVSPAERIELLETASVFLPLASVLPLRSEAQWSDSYMIATVRAHFMLLKTRIQAGGWSGRQGSLDEWDFEVLTLALDSQYGEDLASSDWVAGARKMGIGWCEDNVQLLSRVGCNPWTLTKHIVAHRGREYVNEKTARSRRAFADSLQRLVEIGKQGFLSLRDQADGPLSLLLPETAPEEQRAKVEDTLRSLVSDLAAFRGRLTASQEEPGEWTKFRRRMDDGNVAEIFDSNRLVPAVRRRLGDRTFAAAKPRDQLQFVRMFQKYGFIREAMELIGGLDSDHWKPGERAELALLELKLMSQEHRFREVIDKHGDVDAALREAGMPLRTISAFHRLGVAHATEGNVKESDRAFERAAELSSAHNQTHAKYTGIMLRAVAEAFRTGEGRGGTELTRNVIEVLREAQTQYLSARVEPALDQADRPKSFIVCLAAEAAVLLHCTESRTAGLYVLALAHVLGSSTALRSTGEGYAELRGLVDDRGINDLLDNELEAEGAVLEELRKADSDLVEQVTRDGQCLDVLDSNSWETFSGGFHARLAELWDA